MPRLLFGEAFHFISLTYLNTPSQSDLSNTNFIYVWLVVIIF